MLTDCNRAQQLATTRSRRSTLGYRRDRRRRHWRRRRGRRGSPRLSRRALRTARLRQGHLQPQHQAHPRRPPLSASRAGCSWFARPSASAAALPKCPAPGPSTAHHRAALRRLGRTVLRLRRESLRLAFRKPQPRPLAMAFDRDEALHAIPTLEPCGLRGGVSYFDAALRRCASAHQSRANLHRPRRRLPELCPCSRADEAIGPRFRSSRRGR